jgi:hypothetical protein
MSAGEDRRRSATVSATGCPHLVPPPAGANGARTVRRLDNMLTPTLRRGPAPVRRQPVSSGGRRRPPVVSADPAWGRIVFIGGCGQVVAAWPVAGEARPDLGTVDALARLRVAAARLGLCIEVWEMRPELAELVELAGLRQVLEGRGLGGETERGEEVADIEEAVEPGDPIA